MSLAADANASRLPFNDAAHADDVLLQRYLDALDVSELVDLARRETAGLLSGLFLPAVSDAYLNSRVRVMLVGQEPKKWGKGLQAFAAGECPPAALDAYVRAQMAVYRKAAAVRRPGHCKFLQFRRALRVGLGDAVAPEPAAVHWANLLCMSLNNGSPSKASQFEAIRSVSKKLLAVQLELLQPDLVVFGTGADYDVFLKDQLGSYTTLPGLKPREFWPFQAAGSGFLGWRVRHPRRLGTLTKRELVAALRTHATVLMAPA